MSQATIKKTSDYFKSKGVVLPSISELQDPQIINDDIKNSLKKINNNDINPLLTSLEFIGLIKEINQVLEMSLNTLYFQQNLQVLRQR